MIVYCELNSVFSFAQNNKADWQLFFDRDILLVKSQCLY